MAGSSLSQAPGPRYVAIGRPVAEASASAIGTPSRSVGKHTAYAAWNTAGIVHVASHENHLLLERRANFEWDTTCSRL